MTAAAIASRSSRPSSPTGTCTPWAPASVTAIGYASNDRHGTTTSSPGWHTAVSTCPSTATEPHPATMFSGATPSDAAMAPTSSVAYMSGYRLTSSAASEMASTTDGRGGYGFSLDDSLNAAAPTGTRAPGT